MKKIITLALILTVISFTSCKKKTTEPSSSSTTVAAAPAESIKVQYRVSSASGHFNVEYVSVEDGKATTTSLEVGKIAFTYSFNWTKKQNLSVKAFNSTPSSKEVLVEIYVNDKLFKSGLSNIAGGIAVAEGVYND